MMPGLDLEEGGRRECAVGIAISYLAFSGMVAAAFLLMKFVIALQSLSAVPPSGF
jgi:hypothetical protein